MSSLAKQAAAREDFPAARVPDRPSYTKLRDAIRSCRAWIHHKPDRWHVRACLPWLEAELEVVKPEVLVCLGATAAQALLGSQVSIGRVRRRPGERRIVAAREVVAVTGASGGVADRRKPSMSFTRC